MRLALLCFMCVCAGFRHPPFVIHYNNSFWHQKVWKWMSNFFLIVLLAMTAWSLTSQRHRKQMATWNFMRIYLNRKLVFLVAISHEDSISSTIMKYPHFRRIFIHILISDLHTVRLYFFFLQFQMSSVWSSKSAVFSSYCRISIAENPLQNSMYRFLLYSIAILLLYEWYAGG